MPINHNIVVTLQNGKDAVPNEVMKIGETVSFSSPDGEVTVVYPNGWPFEGDPHDIKDSKPLKLKMEGVFPFRCFVTPPGGPQPIGWSEEHSPMSGANTRVGH
jgi:hypothetical protein